MANNDAKSVGPNVRSSSTTLLGLQPKMSRHPQGIKQPAQPSAAPKRRKAPRSVTAPVQVVMTIRPGGEPSVILRGSGITWRYPADRSLYDVVMHFNWLIEHRA